MQFKPSRVFTALIFDEISFLPAQAFVHTRQIEQIQKEA